MQREDRTGSSRPARKISASAPKKIIEIVSMIFLNTLDCQPRAQSPNND